MSERNNSPRISFAIPVYNEEAVVPALLRRVFAVMDSIEGVHEVVIVDDGSVDNTVPLLRKAAQVDQRLIVVELSKIILDQSPEGFTALISVVVFLGGVQMLFLGVLGEGVLGEYVGRIYEEVKQRPQFIVSRVTHGKIELPDNSPKHKPPF